MPESLTDHFDRYSGFNEERSVGVADVVESDLGNTGSGGD